MTILVVLCSISLKKGLLTLSFPIGHEESPPVPGEELFVLPLSFGQERLWFLNQLEPGSPAYNVFMAVQLTGHLDQDALQKSLSEIVQRHEILRTTFSLVDGQLAQIIASQSSCQLIRKDMRDLPQDQRETEVAREVEKEAGHSFDLVHGPLFRATLLWLATDEYMLLLALHHIIFDEWSSGILKRELGLLYNTYRLGQPSPLPELSLQYADFAVWQRQVILEPAIAQQLAYWLRQLAPPLPQLALLTDRPRTTLRSTQGANKRFILSPGLLQRLKELGQREGATLFMALLAAFSALLYRYSQQEDILVGTPITNRNQAELEPLIGFFLNTLVLRIDLSDQPTFQELLSRVRTLALQAYANQDIPFDKVVDALHKEKKLDQQQLVQVMFSLEDAADEPLHLSGLTSRRRDVEMLTTKFDLDLSCTEDAEHGLTGSFTCATDLFDEATILALAEHFTLLLEQICQHPTLPIRQLSLLSRFEREQVLFTWNKTQASSPRDKCVHELFEEQVTRTPDTVAVVGEEWVFTYGELNARANQLARHLRQLGVGPDVLVGLCLERSLELIVGLFGILKAGGAYVPLDPTYPQNRLAYLLEETRVPMLLTQQHLLGNIPTCGAGVICLDSDWPEIAQQRTANLSCNIQPQNLAYVIYTSGSTGAPKGVLTTHQALTNYVQFAVSAYGITVRDRILQFASINFDASTEEIYPCLVQGATLVLRTGAMPESAQAFLQTCQQQSLTCLSLPTAYWHALATQLGTQPTDLPACLRLVIIGGEAAHLHQLSLWQHAVQGKMCLVNTYGPTEATVIATLYEVEPQEKLTTASLTIPLGRPIANTRVYVLDPFLQPVPPGVPGELAIGGTGLARGYLRRPDLTATSFVPDPFGPLPGQRLYLTGDRVRYTRHGLLEFLGRMDHQVKIRGYRVELAEIETCLLQHPAVRTCAVILHEDVYGAQRLVAYCVSDAAKEVSPKELQRFVQERLPHYMVPTLFVALEDLPLTPQGKVARHALPQPDIRQLTRDTEFSAPRTPLEMQLAALWNDLLHLEQISLEDNFFTIGGDSLLSIFFVMRAQQAGLPLKAQDVLQHPTIAALASLLEQQPGKDYRPLTQSQQWFLETYLAAHPEHWHLTIALEVAQPITPMQLEQAVQRIIDEHKPLRLCCNRTSTGWQQYSAETSTQESTAWFDLAHLAQEEQIHAIKATISRTQRDLNTCTGALAGVVYFDLGSRRPGLLFWNLHLLILDLLSSGSLLTALAGQQGLVAADQAEQASAPQQFAEQLTCFFQEPGQTRNWPLFTSMEEDLLDPLKEHVWHYLATLQEALADD